MLIEMLAELVIHLWDIMTPFSIPQLPIETLDYISSFITYIQDGASILAAYVPIAYIFTLFSLIIAIDAAFLIYHFVMWILRKIPAASIS